jgi:hypothetical protein
MYDVLTQLHRLTPALAEQLAEAASFTVYFSGSPAALSTPHLYISALSTWPRNLEPCGRWRSCFQGIPAFKNAARGGALSLVNISVGSEVNSVAFSTDGTHIVSGSRMAWCGCGMCQQARSSMC